MSQSSIPSITSLSQYTTTLSSSGDKLFVLLFTTAWHAPCQQMLQVAEVLAKQYKQVAFYQLDAEAVSDVTEQHPVESVPTVIFIKNGKMITKLEGVNPPEFSNLVSQHASASTSTTSAPSSTPSSPPAASVSSASSASAAPAAVAAVDAAALNARLAALTKAAPVMIFIKGTPTEPKCGFTKKLLAVLDDAGVRYDYFNILSDNAVREGLKAFSNWPTYPQVYINGELVGGLDVVKELVESGEFKSMVPSSCLVAKTNAIEEQLKQLISQERIMLFMKGTKEQPVCGFSNQAVALLNSLSAEFGSYNILADDAVREALKVYSNWPTYPQLYVDGELVGGLDVMKELHDNGELAQMLAEKK